MNRTLKRPMFRMGGSTGTGITSGLDRPGYRQGTTVGNTFFPYGEGDRVSQGALDMINAFPNRMNAMKQPTVAQGSKTPMLSMNQDITPSIKRLSTEERMREAMGGRDRGRDFSKFLIQGGLNLVSGRGGRGTLASIADAFKDPTSELFSAEEEQAELERQIKLAAVQSDIGQEQAVELQLLKNLDDDTRTALMKKVQEGVDAGFYKDVNEGIRRQLQKEEFGVQNMPGEQRQKEIATISENLQTSQRISPIEADRQAEFYVDYNRIEKANPDVNFDVQNPFWDPKRSSYQEGVVYYDPVGKKYFRRDSGSEASEGTPQGFVEVQIN